MLVRFSVENFMSFDTRQEFSMAASMVARSRHKNHVIPFGKRKVLKGGFIYGANASGKSNLIKAIDFSIDIILMGIKNVDLDKKYFRVKSENINKPGVFQYDFVVNDKLYSYGYAVSYSKKEVIDEWFYEIRDNKEVCIFSRELIENDVVVNSDIKLHKKEDRDTFEVYKKDIKRMKEELFFAEIVRKQIDDVDFYNVFNRAYRWFQKVLIIFPDSTYGQLENIASDVELREEFKKYLKYFDTGVENVSNAELDFDKALKDLDDDVRNHLKKELLKNLSLSPITLRGGNIMLSIYENEEGDIVAQKMMLDHGNSLDLFDYDDESDGTKRLFDLIPIFFGKDSDSVIIVDEIDRSLHSCLTSQFIDLFYKLSENNKTQLITTTHDSNLMDLDKLRQDEIWFVERKKEHNSVMYSLDKFKERYDKKVEKDYLIGRYGAVPVFDSFTSICEMDVDYIE